MDTRFNPASSVRFDFDAGAISVADGGRRLLVPADMLLSVLGESPAEAQRDFGQRLGTEMGRRVAERLGEIKEAGIEAVLEHLGGELALAGLGSLGLERWGNALVFTVSGATELGSAHVLEALIAAALEGALRRALGREVSLVPLVSSVSAGRSPGSLRLVALGAERAAEARALLASGVSWGDLLSRLHGSKGAS